MADTNAIAQWWIDNAGVPPHVAAAIAKSAQVESGGNPTLLNRAGGGQGAYGTHQWRGPRLQALEKLPDYEDPIVQQRFAYSEVTGGDPQAAKAWPAIKAAKTEQEAYRLWRDNFGRGEDSAGYRAAAKPEGYDPEIGATRINVSPIRETAPAPLIAGLLNNILTRVSPEKPSGEDHPLSFLDSVIARASAPPVEAQKPPEAPQQPTPPVTPPEGPENTIAGASALTGPELKPAPVPEVVAAVPLAQLPPAPPEVSHFLDGLINGISSGVAQRGPSAPPVPVAPSMRPQAPNIAAQPPSSPQQQPPPPEVNAVLDKLLTMTGAVPSRATDTEQAERQAERQAQPAEPLVGVGEGGALTGRIANMAEGVTPFIAGGAPGGTLSSGMRLGRSGRLPSERIEPTFERPPNVRTEPPPAENVPTTGGQPPREPPREPPANAPGPKLDPPPGIGETAKSLDDSLYTVWKNNEADMREVANFMGGHEQTLRPIKRAFGKQAKGEVPQQWLDPAFQERAYTETEARMMGRPVTLSPDVAAQERMLKPFTDDVNRIANKLRSKLGRDAVEIPDLPTAEEGYVHRKIIGRPGPGERLDPGTQNDVITGGGRSLSRRAASLERRTQNFVGEDEAGNRVWSRKLLGEPGTPSAYGEQYRIGSKTYTAKPPTTAEIEANTQRRYVKNYLANTIDNWLRLRRIERNVDLLDEWKPELYDRGMWVPAQSQAPIPPGFVRVDLPQLQGFAPPRIAAVLNDFYNRTPHGSLVGYLEKANRFLIGTMFALPIRHQLNVGTHYAIGRGWDWFRSNPMLPRAIKAVGTQNPDYIRLLREGAGLQYANTLNQNFYKTMLEKLFHDQLADPQWEGVAKALGTNISDLVRAEYNWSRKALWKVNDVFLVARIMELEGKGLPTKQAIFQAEREIPNYRIPDQVMRSRPVAAALKSNLGLAFGRYTYGRYRAIAEMVKDLSGYNGVGKPQMDALGQAVVMVMLGGFGYKMANAALQSILPEGSSQRPMEFARGGPLGMMQAGLDYASRQLPGIRDAARYVGMEPGEKDFSMMLQSFISPSPLLGIANIAMRNQDWAGRPVIDPNASTRGAVAQGLEGAASLIYPAEVGIDVMRKGFLPGVGPALGLRQPPPPPSGKVQRMLRGRARGRERKDPIEQALPEWIR